MREARDALGPLVLVGQERHVIAAFAPGWAVQRVRRGGDQHAVAVAAQLGPQPDHAAARVLAGVTGQPGQRCQPVLRILPGVGRDGSRHRPLEHGRRRRSCPDRRGGGLCQLALGQGSGRTLGGWQHRRGPQSHGLRRCRHGGRDDRHAAGDGSCRTAADGRWRRLAGSRRLRLHGVGRLAFDSSRPGPGRRRGRLGWANRVGGGGGRRRARGDRFGRFRRDTFHPHLPDVRGGVNDHPLLGHRGFGCRAFPFGQGTLAPGMRFDHAFDAVDEVVAGREQKHVVDTHVVRAVQLAQTVQPAPGSVHRDRKALAPAVHEHQLAVIRKERLQILQQAQASLGKTGPRDDVPHRLLADASCSRLVCRVHQLCLPSGVGANVSIGADEWCGRGVLIVGSSPAVR